MMSGLLSRDSHERLVSLLLDSSERRDFRACGESFKAAFETQPERFAALCAALLLVQVGTWLRRSHISRFTLHVIAL